MPPILSLLISNSGLIAEAMSLLKTGISIAPALTQKIKDQADLIHKIVSENRDPTPEEWAALNTEISANEAILNAPDAPVA